MRMPTQVVNTVTTHMSPRAKNPGGSTYRVLVADAFAASRAGVRAAISPHGFTIAAEAADLDDALKAAAREQPDVCLLSLGLGEGAADAVRALAEAAPNTRVIALADNDSDDEAAAVLAAGASGYLSRAGAIERLPSMLAAVVQGQTVVPAQLMVRLAKRALHERRRPQWWTRPRTALSPRERQVLEGLRAGKTNADIAVELGVSAVTVRRDVSGVLRKASVDSREALGDMLSGGDAS